LSVLKDPLVNHKNFLIKSASEGDEDQKELLMKEVILVDEALIAHTKPFKVNY
jgi:hypothetical protein